MFKKKQKADLSELSRALNLIKEFNKSQVEVLERVKELEKKCDDFGVNIGNCTTNITSLWDSESFLNNWDEEKTAKELTFQIRDHQYSLVPNCRNKELINKKNAVKIIKVNENGAVDIEYTSIEDLSKEEVKEYEESKFLIKRF